jgi:type IV secretory pathway protease TraF
LKNSQNQPYILDERGYRVLSLYEKDYKGIIPEDAYLILGNLPQGSLDSSHFGLVGKKDILGKVRVK